MGDRITLVAGDFLAADLGADFDAALIANVVHGLTEADARRLVARGAAALRPGGRLFVVDQLAERVGGPATAAINALLALSYRIVLGGRTWPSETIASWLTAAGLADVRLHRPRRTPGTAVVTGTRSATVHVGR